MSNRNSKPGRPLVLDAVKVAERAARDGHTVVLVEGHSDELAVAALAGRFGRDLEAEGVTIVTISGATNIGHFLNLLGPGGLNAKVAGLCDVGEEHHFQTALELAGFGSFTRSEMEAIGFFVCDVDLEDELIRSLGVDGVLKVTDEQGELGAFRTFQKQPEWRERSAELQFRRWLGTKSLRKYRYARLLVDALDLNRAPAPLHQLLEHVLPG